MRKILIVGTFLFALPAFAANTWYVRGDGGTRYDATTYAYGECTGTTDAAYPGTNNNAWQPEHAYNVGDVIVDGKANYETVTTAGTSGSGNFVTTWPAHGAGTVGVTTTTDNTVVWTYEGAAPYDQACGFGDIRYLWSDSTSASSWAIAGGDTVIIENSYPTGETGWRVGPANATGKVFFGYGGVNDGWPFTTYNLPIPAGTSANPTIIEGANYASCSTELTPPGATPTLAADPTKTTKIFGGFAVNAVLNAQNTQYVVFRCLDISDHSSCISHGSVAPAPTSGFCNHSTSPYTDFAASGILTNNQTANVTFQDVTIHGLPSSGFYGAIGGPITMTRVLTEFNGFAGWNFDDSTPNNPASTITANYVTMDWNGCNEEYPITDPWPGTYCYTTGTYGGFGDAWSGQNAAIQTITCNHCQVDYNIKDGWFGPHTFLANVTIENSTAMGNGGQTWKANLGYTGNMTFENNFTKNNCYRLKQPFSMMTAAQASEFNNYLETANMCRPGADGAAMTLQMPVTGSFTAVGNTFVISSPKIGLDLSCSQGIGSISLVQGNTAGTAQVGDVLSLGGTGATATVTTVSAGVVTGVSLATNGQWYLTFPYTETYVYDETNPGATGIQISYATATTISCTSGAYVLKDNLFIGYQDYSAQNAFNGGTGTTSPVKLFCYTDVTCGAKPGTFIDSSWTARSNNYYYGLNSGGEGYCTYPSETCGTDPLLTNEPNVNTAFTNEDFLDYYDFSLTASSPVIGAGVAYTGFTTDYCGTTRPASPAISAVELNSCPTLSSITAAPSTATVAIAGTQLYSATCNYSDASTSNCSDTVTWTSGTPSVATVDGWTATGMASGSSSLTAALGPVTSSAVTLNVTGVGSSGNTPPQILLLQP